jgi:aminoglycoside phosphotransferase (APT) family kinase protein
MVASARDSFADEFALIEANDQYLIERDQPSQLFLDGLRERFPTEKETDALLIRKMQNRSQPPYHRPSIDELCLSLNNLLTHEIGDRFTISEASWFTGGVSKIQLGFTLEWIDPVRGPSRDRMVIRMDPAESLNSTSRVREFQLLRAFNGVLPVPTTYWIDADCRWFPEPALIYSFVDGISKPRGSTSGQVTGLGTVFGPELRSSLGPQFIEHLARIHTFDFSTSDLSVLDVPAAGSVDGALWQLNRARRVWEEDRGENFPLMDLAANWLERNLPKLDHVSVVHGDYRSGNFLFDEHSGAITAWLDWERGHLGDRHRDLAWTTQLTFGHYDESRETYFVCGLVPLDEFYERYEQASGLSVDQDRLTYYRILNCYQIVVALLGTAFRVIRLGKSHQGLLLARLKGEAASTAVELHRLLSEVC